MGTFAGPGTNGQVVTITSSKPVTGKYVVFQLKEESQVLNLNEVKVTCSGKVVLTMPCLDLVSCPNSRRQLKRKRKVVQHVIKSLCQNSESDFSA